MIFSDFSPFFGDFTQQLYCMHVFYREIFDMVIFHFQSKKNGLENTKIPKNGSFHPFLPIFRGLETIWGNIEKP